MTFKLIMSTTAPHLSCRTAHLLRVSFCQMMSISPEQPQTSWCRTCALSCVRVRSPPIGTIDGVQRAMGQQRTLLTHPTAQSSLIWTTLSGRPSPKSFVLVNPNPLLPPNMLGHNHRDLTTQSVHAPTTKVHERRLVAIVTRTWRHHARLPGKPASMAPSGPRRGSCPPHSWTSPPAHRRQSATCPLRFP